MQRDLHKEPALQHLFDVIFIILPNASPASEVFQLFPGPQLPI